MNERMKEYKQVRCSIGTAEKFNEIARAMNVNQPEAVDYIMELPEVKALLDDIRRQRDTLKTKWKRGKERSAA
jgi:hypothetical protein